MQQIKVNISNTGEVSYEVQGVKGSGCAKLTAAIDALSNVRETKKTAEYFQTNTQQGVQTKS